MSSKPSPKFVVMISIITMLAASLACASRGKDPAGGAVTATPASTATAEVPPSAVAADETSNEVASAPTQMQASPANPTIQPPPVQSGSDNIPPDFGTSIASDTRVYYNKRSCGVTKLGIEVRVTDNVAVESVWIQYRFNGTVTGGTISNWKTALFTKQGTTNVYTILLDTAEEPKAVLNGSNGLMEYQLFARDFAGNQAAYPSGSELSIEVVACK